MKKLLFLLFCALFALAGCADESGTNGGNTEICPISSADFSYERVVQNQYQMKLDNESKRQYAGGVRWEAFNTGNMFGEINTTKLEPLLEYNNYRVTYPKEITFYYNNNQCGETIILKPKSTNPNCDNILIDYSQRVYYGSPRSSFYIQFKDINQLDNTLKYTLRFSDSLNVEPITINNDTITFYALYNQIEHLIGPMNMSGIFADFIIDYSDGSQCIKEIYFTK